ncbi:MAG: ComF family protein [Campylobacteraceae bacterium]
MRCVLCQSLSFRGICKNCIKKLLREEKHTRILPNNLKVYSFFSYDSIAPILHVKHHFFGHRVLKQIAKITFAKFASDFTFPNTVYAIAIDDDISSGYAHTAILTNALKSASIKPLYRALRAKNKVKYSGKSFEFRRKNPRRFSLHVKGGIDAILVDDIITSGQTLKEAHECLTNAGINVLFALTLADAKA